MGLLGLFGRKKKSSDQSLAPDIEDLPPIPEPDYDINSASLDNLDSMEIPDLPEDRSFDDLSEISPDHPLPNLSPNDLHPDLSAELSLDESSLDENNLSGNDALDSSSQDKPPQDAAIKNQGSSPKITEKSEPLEDYPKSSQAKPSLPVFEEVALPTQIDMESLTISELFIKREQYSQVLETLYTAQKELDALIKKSAVAKPNEKIGILLKKATTKHAELNKDLMFVEEHLIE